MKVKKDEELNIEQLQNRIINQAILAFLIIGSTTQIFETFRSIQFGFSIGSISGYVSLFFVVVCYIFRKRIPAVFKVSLMLFIIFYELIINLYSNSFLASVKFFIPIIPVFVSFIASYKKAFMVLTIYLTLYCFFAFLATNGSLNLEYDVNDYISSPNTWLVELSIILLTSVGLLTITRSFVESLSNSYDEIKQHRDNLEVLVRDRTNKLATINDELKSTNDELIDKSEIIEHQNQELKITLQHLKETQSQLLQSEKMASLGILTAGVAHEINNPLNYIMGAYDGLRHHFENKSFSENSEQIGVLINALKVGVDRSSAIVRGLSEFSRNSKSHDEECDIHAIINNSHTMLRNQMKEQITVNKEFFTSDIFTKGNVGNLHQVFINLLSNSNQSIDNEGEITIVTACENDKIIVKIIDTGEGISPDNLKKVTDPFFTTKAPGKGTGLGLSIVYNIIKEHQGEIEITSELGKGTTVVIELPKK